MTIPVQMRNRSRGAKIAIAASAAVVALSLLASPVATQAPPYTAPRTVDGKPDLNGIWQAVGTAHWDIEDHLAQPPAVLAMGAIGAVPAGYGIVEGGEIPYQPWAAARKKENFEKRMTVDPFNRSIGDPEVKCYLPGVPRATYLPFPFQILQGTDTIAIAYEFAGASRFIHMTEVPPSPVDTWMGHSVGRWEGDTLVVDVTSQLDQTWFDRAGNFHSDALHVVERYTPITPYHLNYEATIEDPRVFTRPWKISLPLYRRMDEAAEVLEFRCLEFVEPLLLGPISK